MKVTHNKEILSDENGIMVCVDYDYAVTVGGTIERPVSDRYLEKLHSVTVVLHWHVIDITDRLTEADKSFINSKLTFK